MSDVFVSYARVDQPFVRRLCASLALLSKDVWADFEDIPPTAAWLEEVFRGIDAAHTFAFVITPDSVRSETCRRELDHAVDHHKRIVPLVRREVAHPDTVSRSACRTELDLLSRRR